MERATKLGTIVAVAVLVAASQTAVGQYEWRPGEGVSGTDGAVNAMTLWDPDGAGPQPERLVIGGAYIVAGTAVGNRIVAWDGTNWQALGSGMNNTVSALTVYNGQLVAGGSFTTAGGVTCNYIASWDGSSWQPLDGGVSGGAVSALAVYNGELIVGGTFTAAGGVGRNRIARWDGSSWQGLGSGITGTAVSALSVYNGQLIVGGAFTAAGGVACSNIASWDGSAWQPLDGGANASVSALAVYGGQLVAGGSFTTAGGVACKCVARWDGTVWQPLGGGITTGTNVYALGIYNSLLIVGGNFTAAGGVSCQRLASWDGSSWQPVDGGMSGPVNAVAAYNGQLIAGGNFTVAGGATCNYIGRYNGSVWQPLYNGMNGVVSALTVYNGELIAGGTFTSAGGVVCNCIARRAGSSWQAMGSGMNSPVSVLAVYNGQLIAGGSFTTAGGVSCNRIAAWNGSVWQPLDGGTNNTVTALTVWNDLLVAGGTFTAAGGVPCKYVATWNGATWQALDGGMNNSVAALTVYNGQLIAGGNFTLGGTTTCNRIALWDGSAWQPLGTGMNGSVAALTVYNGELVAGGGFTSAGGVACNYIARWNGSNWQILDGGTNGAVTTLTVYNGKLVAGGSFGAAGGIVCRTIALWDGSTWQALGAGLNGSTMSALTVYNGELVAGDNFTIADGTKVSAYWARWGPVMPTILEQPVSQSILLGDPVTFSISAIGAGTLNYQWRKDGLPLSDGGTIGGATTAVLTISAVATGDMGSYDCVVTNYAGSATSDAATLTVLVPAAIVTQPVSQAVNAGDTATLSVSAIGTDPLSYQWRKGGIALTDGGRISGSATATLTITALEVADADTYDVVVSNLYGTATSTAVTITVLPTIVAQPAGQSVTAGDPIALSVTAVGSGTLAYQWRKDGLALSDDGRISGSTTSALTINPSQTGDAGSYDVVVSSEYGTVTSDAAGVTVTVPIIITTQPASQSVKVGDPVAFSVVASGAGTLSYQWRKDGAPLSDGGTVTGATTSTLTIDPVALVDAGSYDVVVGLGGDSVTSSAASLTILGAEPTPAGSQVSVQLVDPGTGLSCATVTFQDVTSSGITAVATAAPGPGYGPPEGFKVGAPPVVYQLETTATFSGTVEVCFNYGNISYGRERNLHLFHFDGGWVDVTTSLDTVNKRICGQVTHLSAFGVFEKLNAAPTVTITAPASGYVQAVNTNLTLTATISDADPGDTHTASWTILEDYWGEQVVPGTVNGTSVQNVIQLSQAGIYHISVTVTDEDGATGTANTVNNDPAMPAFVVIYDPNGGYVTGGGWILSPAGALRWVPDEINNAEGKATFGFVAKYQQGASVPSGNTEFNFHAGDFQFKSTQYEWLVVAGDKARYSGSGAIRNLSGTYAFVLTAVDRSSGDRFRIKIWDDATGHVIYDNKRGEPDDADPTLIGGGSIIIHH